MLNLFYSTLKKKINHHYRNFSEFPHMFFKQLEISSLYIKDGTGKFSLQIYI